MQQQPESTSIQLIRGERTLLVWLGYAFLAAFGLIDFFGGTIAGALFEILCAELIITFWRPTPRLTPQSYTSPMSSFWQPVDLAARWYGLASGCWSLIVGFVACAGIAVFALIFVRPHSFGPANYAVLVLFGVWLLGHPIWSPPLKGWVRRQTADVRKELGVSVSPLITLRPDGMDIDLRVQSIGRPVAPWIIPIQFAELEEIRALDSLDAQAYWQSLLEQDPSVGLRIGTEMFQYANHMVARPAIYQQLTIGVHLLLRGATLLYLFGGQDDSAPAVVTAFHAWQAAQAEPKPTPG